MIKVAEGKGKTLITFDKIERIDKSNVQELEYLIENHIKEKTDIFLNLNKVFFIDTEGFMKLLSLNNKVEKSGGKVRLVQISDALSELFHLMELHDKFEWASTEQLTDLAFSD